MARISRFSLPVLLVLCAICATAAPPADAPPADVPELLTRFDHYSVAYTINADGSYDEDRDWSMTVLEDKAVAAAKQTSISYSTSIQSAEVKQAYTLKPDGRRIDVPTSNFQIVARTGRDASAPVFSDWTTMTVVFPDVAAGDVLVLAYRLTAREPMFPGEFSVQEAFERDHAYDDVSVTIDTPLELWAQYAVREMKEVRNEEANGRKILAWTYQNKQPVKNKREDYSVFEVEQEPGFAFSTFHNYAEIAEAYGASARHKAVVTDRVRKLADEIASGPTEPREVARALYEWVARKISYAGNCVGLGAVVPHDIDFVLDNRMGDCKDHATLLQALLAAKGIDSTQALINAGSSYRLPKIPVVAMVNHVINYIPSLQLYVDSTSDSTPFGALPAGDTGKPVLHVDGYRDGTHTPVPPPGSNEQVMRTTIHIQPDGSYKGDAEIELKGMFAAYARALFRALPKDREQNLLKDYFRSQGHIGSGALNRGDAEPLLDSYHYHAIFEVQEVLQFHGPGAFSVDPILFSQSPISQYLDIAIADVDPAHDVACANGRSVEEYRYQLPKGVKILATPDDFQLNNDFLSYSATYRFKGDTLTVKRVFDDRTPSNVCSPDMMNEYKVFARKVLQDIKSQVVYK